MAANAQTEIRPPAGARNTGRRKAPGIPTAAIRELTRWAKALLVQEAFQSLEEVCGLNRDGVLSAGREKASEEGRKARHLVEERRRSWLSGNLPPSKGAAMLAREVAFAHLCHQVALHMLNVRGLFPAMREDPAGTIPPIPDPAGLAALLPPGRGTLERLAERLCDPSLDAAWAPFAEETLGWIFQAFNAEELEKAYAGARLEGRRIPREEIPLVTQLFTPPPAVRFLVENTLGRLWLDLHPDSRLRGRLPLNLPIPTPARPPQMKLARDIQILDPTCGTMHFGLEAFELLVAMYREELERAGEPGWPETPSVAARHQIPAAILASNLHGIDVDPWALRLAHLALHLRALSHGARGSIPCPNLACAGPEGSLARPEDREDPGDAGEILTKRYDIVLTNPPYLSARKLDAEFAGFLRKRFPEAQGDLYAAFVQRCLELTRPEGMAGLLTMHSFLFLPSYEGLRRHIRSRAALRALAHYGPGLFDVGNPGTLQTAAFVLERPPAGETPAGEGVFLRLVREPGGEAKTRAQVEAAARWRRGKPDPRVSVCSQEELDALPGSPWVYWLTPSLRKLFETLLPLSAVARPRQGLATSDNARFLRHWWEVEWSSIDRSCPDTEASLSRPARWYPYMKGGSSRRWYGNQHWVVNWHRNGEEIKARILEAYPYLQGKWQWVAKNADHYFRRGITYSYLTAGSFSARLSPGGFIFDVAGSSLFPEDTEGVLGILNSRLGRWMLSVLNPTVNFQVGDLARLPMPGPLSRRLRGLVREAVLLAQAEEEEDETSPHFVAPPAWPEGVETLAARRGRLAEVEKKIDREVYRLYRLGQNDRKAVEFDLGLASPPHPTSSDSQADTQTDTLIAKCPDMTVYTEVTSAIAFRWIRYSVSLALGRCCPGRHSEPGAGQFSAEQAEHIARLALPHGLGVLEEGHPADLAERTLEVLTFIHGVMGASSLIDEALGRSRSLRDRLASYLARAFFRDHLRIHRRCPPLWLIQSPGLTWSAYLDFGQATSRSISLLKGPEYLGWSIQRSESADLCKLDTLFDTLIFNSPDNGKQQGWKPEPDDGIRINAAPIRAVLPSWKGVPLEDIWHDLAKGRLDWSKTAQRYWPERVTTCRRRFPGYNMAQSRSNTD